MFQVSQNVPRISALGCFIVSKKLIPHVSILNRRLLLLSISLRYSPLSMSCNIGSRNGPDILFHPFPTRNVREEKTLTLTSACGNYYLAVLCINAACLFKVLSLVFDILLICPNINHFVYSIYAFLLIELLITFISTCCYDVLMKET